MESKLRSGKKYKAETIVFYDLETTGLNPYYDNIIEIGAIKYQNGNTSNFKSFVSLKYPIPKKISEITNIYDSDLKDQPSIETVLKSFLNFIKQDDEPIYMVAHNNDAFDRLFLEINLVKNNLNKPNINYIDTLRLSQKIIPKRYSYSLKSLCKDYDIYQECSHRAYDDAYSLFMVYKKICAILSMNIDYSYKYIVNNPWVVFNYINTV